MLFIYAHISTIIPTTTTTIYIEKGKEMEGDKETESRQKETKGDDDECSFVWDDATQLYFHSRFL